MASAVSNDATRASGEAMPNRRQALATTAAGLSAFLGSIVEAQPASTIPALIRAHREALEASEAAWVACSRIEEANAEVLPLLRAQIGWRKAIGGETASEQRVPVYAYSTDEIVQRFSELVSPKGPISPAWAARYVQLRDKALAEFRATADALKAAEDACGFTAAEAKANEVSDREGKLLDQLLATLTCSTAARKVMCISMRTA